MPSTFRLRVLALACASVLFAACDGDPADPDTGTPEGDAGGSDAGEDAGEDAGDDDDAGGADAGTDASVEPECMDECAAGSQSCDGDEEYRVCGQYDLDACLEPSPPIRCAMGFSCEGDTCVPPCRDECPVGVSLCMDESAVLGCGNYDADACREPGGAVSCDSGERCERGACVPTATACTDECATAGATECFGDATRICGSFDSDSCLDLGPPAACGSGEVCAAGECVAYCTDDCRTAGATECVGDAVRTCGEFDGDPCRDWGALTACTGGDSCTAGSCSATCADECENPGGPVCVSGGLGVATCGEFDSDACRDVSSAIYCPLGFECQSGVCVADCTNDCTLGAARCSGDAASVETCGNYDDDICYEWGGAAACPGSATCATGSCNTPCTDECPTAAAIECVSGGNARRTCGQFDLDACREWSAPSACEGFESCVDGVCELGPTPAAILINELLYDAVGADSAVDNTIFVELWGDAGAALDGWELVGVDGNSGSDYNRLALDGEAVGPDGWFVVAHPMANATTRAAADLTSASVDYQNGPDSVQLRWRGRVVDAIGYGTFGSAVFAGEGNAVTGVSPGRSLTRDAAHADTDDNAADFSSSAAPSPRAADMGCADDCAAGTRECSGIQVRTCVSDYDADACLEWNAPAGCPNAGEQCQGAGVCSIPCTNECTSGARQCSGTDVQTCGNFDADACTEWSAAAACPTAGEQCGGAGVCAIPCTDDCTATGVTRCTGTQIQTCGNHDADTCREWSTAVNCPSGQTCSGIACRDASAPEVVLISPMGAIQTTQGNTHRLVVDATAAPGRTISAVHYFAAGVMVGTTNAAPHEFVYTVPAGAVTGSTIAVHATAVDNAGSIGTSMFASLNVRNDVPVASFTATITNVSTVTVDAGASMDTETPGAMLEVCWDWDNNGSCDTPYSTTKITSHDFGASGTFTIGMRVRDAVGQTATTTRTVMFTDIQYIGGVTLSSTLWYGTVIVTGDITVGVGQTLTIAPGTDVLFVRADVDGNSVGDYDLTVNGNLIVNGTAAEPVVISGFDMAGHTPGAWNRILITGAVPSTIQHAIIEYADVGLEIRNASTVTNVIVRNTRSECIRLNNADAATITDSTTTSCGGDGVTVLGGSAGVLLTRHTSTSNGGDGIGISAASSVAATGGTFATNTGNGATIGTGSTLDLTGAVVELNQIGLAFQSTSVGTVRENQIRSNRMEGIGLRSDATGNPNPVINTNNVYSNATVGSTSTSQVDTTATLSASQTCCGTVNSATYTAPANRTIHRVHVSYAESGSGSPTSVNGYLVNIATGAILQTFATNFSGWVFVPAGVTRIAVRVTDTGSSSNVDSIVGSLVELVGTDGASDVAAVTAAGTPDLRYNYLGTFPNVLSRVVLSRTDALNLQGFVGVPYGATWSTGPYRAGPQTTATWTGIVYVTGDLSIAAGEAITVAAGTQVQFVAHDQNLDGRGDFTLTANGRLDLQGTPGAPVLVMPYGAPAIDAFQSVVLAGSTTNASTWTHASVESGRNAVTINGSSSLANVAVNGGDGDGVTLRNATGAALTDVTVIGASDDGVLLDNADGATLTRVSSEMNGGDGFEIVNGSTALTVSRAMSRLNTGIGLRLTGGSAGSVLDSTFRENGSHGVLINGSSPTVDYNLITYNGGVGIQVEGTGSPSAQYNVIKFNDDAGLAIWGTSAGAPTPTLQNSNVFGNSIDGTTRLTRVDTSATLTVSQTCCGTVNSATYTAPASQSIHRVRVSYAESGSGSPTSVNGYLVNVASGAILQTFATNFSGWVFLPAGVTQVAVRVSDTGSSSNVDSIVGHEVELRSFSTTDHYELVAFTDTGTSLARFNYWTSMPAEVPAKIFELRAGSVDYTGFTGLEYPSGSVTQVGPRP